jgi:uncharacterized Zn-finger protein
MTIAENSDTRTIICPYCWHARGAGYGRHFDPTYLVPCEKCGGTGQLVIEGVRGGARAEKVVNKTNLHSGRVVCPKCGRKGVGFAPHPHAFGWKNYDQAKCRYCDARFKIREKVKTDG